jgi:hypothetical protein
VVELIKVEDFDACFVPAGLWDYGGGIQGISKAIEEILYGVTAKDGGLGIVYQGVLSDWDF